MNLFNKQKEKLGRFKETINRGLKRVTTKKANLDTIEICPKCHKATTKCSLKLNQYVCEYCHHHLTIGPNQRIEQLLDPKSFREIDSHFLSKNPDNFYQYQEKLNQAIKNTGHNEAFVGGIGKINNHRVCFGVLDANFIMGSMGSVVGDKVTRLIELAQRKKYPLIMVIASGGARMQEGILSLLQMAKTSAAMAQFSEAGGLSINILTYPTTGGVSASFASLSDIIIAEPQALIGFAGKRVIEKTINETLPDNFQTAEFLLEKGFLDMIVPRKDLRDVLSLLLHLHAPRRTHQ